MPIYHSYGLVKRLIYLLNVGPRRSRRFPTEEEREKGIGYRALSSDTLPLVRMHPVQSSDIYLSS